ncbi:uncharacterized protein LOC142167226 [Nicotiana tabacum]|uniref:Uncharacterized protein LOC142167226 n=1 Tax=Nicotiana tabacum TaxID=4097 RepID=A0AC58SEU3_TOBAC
MEYFGRILKTLETTNGFKYHPKCDKLRLIQLGFADDLLLVFRGDTTSITHLCDCFLKYSAASGLIANISKSSVYFGGADISKKALVAWDKLCYPKSAGGINLIHVQIWNKAAIAKLLWNLSKKKDTLWIQWVHIYSVKQGLVWDTYPKQASWVIQNIFKEKRYVEEVGYDCTRFQAMKNFSIKEFYQKLAALGKLATKDRLTKWGMNVDIKCHLCLTENEIVSHLFFECQFASNVWNKMLRWKGISRQAFRWKEELEWMINNCKGKSASSHIYRIAIAACIYHVWKERNLRIF